MADSKRILLIIGGGIAAYKSLELVRLLRKRNHSVRAILTAAGGEFVTPLSVSSLTGNKVYQDLFDLTDEAEMGHIQLSRSADLVVVAPATADLMAKFANGLANDLASTALLATDTPVMMAPAMNVRMWQAAPTQRNVRQLSGDGVTFVGPETGDMACGEFGPGRMAEPEQILAAIETFFAKTEAAAADDQARAALIAARPMAGKTVLVTAGPTHEPIDPVRYIANRSSGKQGYAIALAAAQLGAETILISGPVTLPDPLGVELVRVETAAEMLEAVSARLPCDAAIFTAAVADWRVASAADQKIKKTGGQKPALDLVENPDILKTVSHLTQNRPALVVGFAAETQDVEREAQAKRQRKGCDWIVANDVSPETGIMGGDANQVYLFTDEGGEAWPVMDKREVGLRLMQRVAEHLAKAGACGTSAPTSGKTGPASRSGRSS